MFKKNVCVEFPDGSETYYKEDNDKLVAFYCGRAKTPDSFTGLFINGHAYTIE